MSSWSEMSLNGAAGARRKSGSTVVAENEGRSVSARDSDAAYRQRQYAGVG